MLYVEDHNIDEDLDIYPLKQMEHQLGRRTNLYTYFLLIAVSPNPSDHCKNFFVKSDYARLKLTILVKFPFYQIKDCKLRRSD